MDEKPRYAIVSIDQKLIDLPSMGVLGKYLCGREETNSCSPHIKTGAMYLVAAELADLLLKRKGEILTGDSRERIVTVMPGLLNLEESEVLGVLNSWENPVVNQVKIGLWYDAANEQNYNFAKGIFMARHVAATHQNVASKAHKLLEQLFTDQAYSKTYKPSI